ncbi:hypothetical protein [Amnibacterium kyonggiense]
MVSCPSCGSSADVQIERDAEQPWARAAAPRGARWSARCDDCGAAWTVTD